MGAALLRDNVSLKVHAYVHCLVVLHGLPAPYAGIIFLQMGYTLEALALDSRFGLAFGKAIRASNGCGGIRRRIWCIDGRGPRIVVCRLHVGLRHCWNG